VRVLLVAFVAFLAVFGGCFGEPDKVEPREPMPIETSGTSSPVSSPSPAPHDVAVLELGAGESAAYIRFTTRDLDDRVAVHVNASAPGNTDPFFLVVQVQDGPLVWADESDQHSFFVGLDQRDVILRFYAKSDAKVVVMATGGYVLNQGTLKIERETRGIQDTVSLADHFFDVDNDTVAVSITATAGEVTVSDLQDTIRATWPANPYTMTALRGQWTIKSSMDSVGPAHLEILRLSRVTNIH
jgi:hypothetical protein